jgi:large subunit ribosomal protein L4e
MMMARELTAKVRDLEGKEIRDVVLPEAFRTPVREDIILRAVVASQSKRVQPQGRDPMAGKRTTAQSRGVGYGMARIPRLDRTLTGKFAPMTVKGRSTHPPRAEKVIRKGINRKERLLAFHSALSATAMPQTVRSRGHILGEKGLPMVVSKEAEDLAKTSSVIELFGKLGLGEDLRRCVAGRRRERDGVRTPKGPLIVVGERCKLVSAARAIPGVDVVSAQKVSVEDLAPGGTAGRLTVWVEPSLEVLTKRLKGEIRP